MSSQPRQDASPAASGGEFRSGFACFAGRPNVGKSTLMNALVGTKVDVIGFCLPASERIGPGDRYLAGELAGLTTTPVVAIVTKTDQAGTAAVAAQLAAVAELGRWADVVPVSAVTGFQLDVLADVLVSHLPPGQPLYPDGELTDEPEQIMVAELIREAALDGVRDELPHSIAVVVEEMGP